MAEKTKTIISVRKDLTGDYMDAFTKDLGMLLSQRESVMQAKKAYNQTAKKTIDDLNEKINKCAVAINLGFEVVDVACYEVRDVNRQEKRYYDINTDEFIRSIPFDKNEQLKIDDYDND